MQIECVCMAEILPENYEKIDKYWLTHKGAWDIIEQREKKKQYVTKAPDTD